MSRPQAQITVHVTPRSGRDVVCGRRLDAEGHPLAVLRVSAPPDKGKANAAVAKLVAKELGVAKSRVSIVRGETARTKVLSIEGDSKQVEEWLAGLPDLAGE